LLDTLNGLGAMDGLHQREPAAAGGILWADNTIRVRHDQNLPATESTAGHYNPGRTMSGFKRQHLRLGDWVRVAGAPFVSLARYAPMIIRLVPRGCVWMLLRSTPEILWLLYAQGLGQLAGNLAGPGSTTRKVQ
jgi:hypothetical protein